jgi:flagellar biosynthesis/type III secretory pathway protein FliH
LFRCFSSEEIFVTSSEQYKKNYQRGYEEGQRKAALYTAKKMLTMKNDPELINHAVRCYIKVITGLCDRDLVSLTEDQIEKSL